MSNKDIGELTAYLKKKREKAIDDRDFYQREQQKEGASENLLSLYKEEAAKAGMEVSYLNYIIRMIDESEGKIE